MPEPSVRILSAVGKWMQKNGTAIYGAERCLFPHGNIEAYTRKGNTLYIHVHFWPGSTLTVGGVRTKVKSAKIPVHRPGGSIQAKRPSVDLLRTASAAAR